MFESTPWSFEDLLVRVFMHMSLIHALLVAIAFWVFHRWAPRGVLTRRIGPGPVSATQVRREVLSTLTSLAIIVLVGLGMYGLARSGLSRLYSDNRYGPVWFVVSIPVMLVLQDTLFYWMHRFMHWKRVFKYVHRVHHVTRDPSPLTAYTLNPTEVLLEMLPVGFIMMTLPVHDYAFLLFLTSHTVANVVGHLGFEMFPKNYPRSWIGRWVSSSTYHHLHHHRPDTNYSFYFSFWDRLMGTLHPQYEATYDAVVNRPPGTLPDASGTSKQSA